MPSPFPGMNPYLEQPDVWHDFHQGYTAALRTKLTAQIRPKYVAKIDDNVYVQVLSDEQRLLLGRPDVAVLENRVDDAGMTAVMTAKEAPAIGRLLPSDDRISESFIEIRDAQYRDLITVIELLSLTNKRAGSDREAYLNKRRVLLGSNVYLVEIDLLRGDTRLPVEGLSDCDYCVMVSRSYRRPEVELWPLSMRQALPSIPIPLKPEDPDAVLDLQAVLHEQFDAAGYADYIYSGTPRPALLATEAEWAKELIGF